MRIHSHSHPLSPPLIFLFASTLLSLPTTALYLRPLPHAPNTKAPRAAALDWDDAATIKRAPRPAAATGASARQPQPHANAPPLSYPADMTKRLSEPSEGYLANRQLEDLYGPPVQPSVDQGDASPVIARAEEDTNPAPQMKMKRNLDDTSSNIPTTQADTTPKDQTPPLPLPPPPPADSSTPPAPPQTPFSNTPQPLPLHQQTQQNLRYTAESLHIHHLAALAQAETDARAAAQFKREWKAERVRREEARKDTPAAVEERAALRRAVEGRREGVLRRVVQRGKGEGVVEKMGGKMGGGGRGTELEGRDPLVGGEDVWRRDLLERLDLLAGIVVEGS